jgi:branched-subunit amino acid ABC-type transport system permease component
MVQYALLFSSIIAILSYIFTLTHISSGFLNLSIVNLLGIGTLSSFLLYEKMGINIFIGLPIVMVIGGIINSSLIQYFYYRIDKKTMNKSLLSLSSFGVYIILSRVLDLLAFVTMKNVPSKLWCETVIAYTTPNPDIHLHFDSSIEIYGVKLSVIMSLILVLIILNTTYWVDVKTKIMDLIQTKTREQRYFGSGIRMIIWFLAGGFAAMAGTLLAFRNKGFFGTRLFYIVPSFLAGSFIGGIDSLFGALFGGLIAGFLDVVLQGLVSRFVGLRIEYIRILFLSSLMILSIIIRAKLRALRS